MAAGPVKELLFGKVVQINKIGLKQIPCALVGHLLKYSRINP